MKEQVLSDEQIAAIMKEALDNNAAIIQFCSMIYGEARNVKETSRIKWHRGLTRQWEVYQNRVNKILEGISDE